MPFWRLQGDGFWQLHNAELCSTAGSSRQPPVKELNEYHVAGGFDERILNFAEFFMLILLVTEHIT
ncbi:hypothetical protein M8756_20570 [Lutimaribacter sp. EGI FJ00015]|nr:hypothetical protein [Lutimaribacter sp. EGI FJ00015]